MKRSVIASLMVVKDALGSLRNLTNLALLSMMKNGEFLSMMTIKNVQFPGIIRQVGHIRTTYNDHTRQLNGYDVLVSSLQLTDFTHTEPLHSMSKKASACSRDHPSSSSERIRILEQKVVIKTFKGGHEPLGKAVQGVLYHIPAAKRVGGFRQSSLDSISSNKAGSNKALLNQVELPVNSTQANQSKDGTTSVNC
ncbi:hypothetical protein Bca4012_081660 [Brassica carinata]